MIHFENYQDGKLSTSPVKKSYYKKQELFSLTKTTGDKVLTRWYSRELMPWKKVFEQEAAFFERVYELKLDN